MPKEFWIALVGGATASVISFAGSLVLLLVTLRHQRERDREAHRRDLTAAKQERLRTAYAALLAAALVFGEVTWRVGFLLGSETREQRNASLAALLQARGGEELTKARISLMLEKEGREALALFDGAIVEPFRSYMSGLAANAESHGSVDVAELRADQERVNEGIGKLRDLAEGRLISLDQPI